MTRVLYHAAAGPDLARRLAEVAGRSALHIDICAETDTARLAALLPETEVLWHVLTPCTAAMIGAAPKLRLIQKIGVGVNTIDLAAAAARGIPVCNLPGTNSQAVAEMTLLLMLAALRRLPLFDAAMRRGAGYALDPAAKDGLGELHGRTVGLVGYGAVPRALVPMLRGLDCRLLYTARKPHPDARAEWRELPDLLAQSDVVSLHVPLTESSARLIDGAALARMKPGAILVNTARGGLIDEPALIAALQSGHLAAAGLDVQADEPPPPDAPLLRAPNVVLSPHIAWISTGTYDRSFALAAENCARLRSGRELLNRVA
ncbi:MAG TPA: NAD(P)-dependent oxidoreductase [Acetobacteraceae bacterium]|nr:NAD(P)-dependent oxidoreductase [Acetobacteraceae bacterium]